MVGHARHRGRRGAGGGSVVRIAQLADHVLRDLGNEVGVDARKAGLVEGVRDGIVVRCSRLWRRRARVLAWSFGWLLLERDAVIATVGGGVPRGREGVRHGIGRSGARSASVVVGAIRMGVHGFGLQATRWAAASALRYLIGGPKHSGERDVESEGTLVKAFEKALLGVLRRRNRLVSSWTGPQDGRAQEPRLKGLGAQPTSVGAQRSGYDVGSTRVGRYAKSRVSRAKRHGE